MSIHRDEIGRILYEETQLLDLYGNELHDAIAGYMSSNKKVATVTKSGKITAKGKGTCNIIAYAHNGIAKSIKVTV